MEAPIQLHQFPKMPLAFAPAAMGPPLPHPAPQPFRQHPAPQPLGIDLHAILRFQMLGRQRRPKPLALLTSVFLPDQPPHFPPPFLRLGATRPAPYAAVFQSRSTLFSV